MVGVRDDPEAAAGNHVPQALGLLGRQDAATIGPQEPQRSAHDERRRVDALAQRVETRGEGLDGTRRCWPPTRVQSAAT